MNAGVGTGLRLNDEDKREKSFVSTGRDIDESRGISRLPSSRKDDLWSKRGRSTKVAVGESDMTRRKDEVEA